MRMPRAQLDTELVKVLGCELRPVVCVLFDQTAVRIEERLVLGHEALEAEQHFLRAGVRQKLDVEEGSRLVIERDDVQVPVRIRGCPHVHQVR